MVGWVYEAILTNTHNIHFHDEIEKNKSKISLKCLFSWPVGTQKRVRISHVKQVISVQVIDVLLYSV